jgi:hypothetical protein
MVLDLRIVSQLFSPHSPACLLLALAVRNPPVQCSMLTDSTLTMVDSLCKLADPWHIVVDAASGGGIERLETQQEMALCDGAIKC